MQDSQAFPNMVRAHIFVTGQVQGVGYRLSTRDQAIALNVSGWVRNLDDGRVEAVFEGTDAKVQTMLQWCQTGPPSAVVQNLAVEYEEPTGLSDFQIVR